MKKLIISSIFLFSIFSFANGQNFEFQENNSSIEFSNIKSSINEDENIIVDNRSEDILIPAKPFIQVNKWMSILQAKERDYTLIEKTLQTEQNANQNIFNGNTILHLAAWQNDERLFRLGIQYGGIIANTNKNGETALHWAAYSKNPNIINMILADKNSFKLINKQDKIGRTPLHFNALQWGNLEVAKSLIANKADLNIKDINGQTPLHYALALKKWELVKLYIDSGADRRLKDKNGNDFDEYIMTKGDIKAFNIFYNYLNSNNQAILKSRLNNLQGMFYN
jgi:ankyrin repeat protein